MGRRPLAPWRLAAASSLVMALAPLDSRAGEAAPDEPPIMVVDLHVDLPFQVYFAGRKPVLTEGQVYPAVAKAGGYGGLTFAIYMRGKAHKDGSHIEDADAILASIDTIIAKNPIFLPLGAKVAEEDKITSFISIEGAGAFAKDISRIDPFIQRGVRMVGPVHTVNGPLSSSSTGERVKHGLTDIGKQFCDRVYSRGALVDVSHMSDAGFMDLVPIAKAYGAPIVASHSNARAVADHARNLTDEELRIIAETGGVAGVNFHTPYVTKKETATMDDVIAQIDHMVKVAGIDHVAIGSDYEGDITPPEGMADASSLQRLGARLRKRGMSRENVLKIFSMNALRVLAWRPTRGVGEWAPKEGGAAESPR